MNKSTLRYQINLYILTLSLCVFLLGGFISLWQARQAVQQEMNSSVNLAKQLVTFQLSQVSTGTTWIQQLQAIKETRHLRIQLKNATSEILETSSLIKEKNSLASPPQWFVRLVKNNLVKIEHPIITNEGQQLLLTIEANPLNEISEVWEECSAFFGLLCLLIGLIFIVIQVLFNHVLKSISLIVNRLASIEEEDYQNLLPEFSNYEMNLLSKAINHLIEKLRESQKENFALIQHTLTIQEDERQRLAQELHDELGQSLTAIKVMTATIAKANDLKNQLVSQSSSAIIEICDHLMNVVRSMMQQLHPLTLTELGLKEALHDLVDNWQMRSANLQIDFECDENLEMCPKSFNIHIFRIVQESLTNVFRHAKASHLMIGLRVEENKLLLEIQDDGVGCSNENRKNGFGLLSMKDRVRSLNGQLKITSELNKGMQIFVSFSMA
ncbi:MAG: histidine kinase [Methylococcaceae bacterium]